MSPKLKKLIHQYGVTIGMPVSEVRRRWLDTPRPERPTVRQRMKDAVARGS